MKQAIARPVQQGGYGAGGAALANHHICPGLGCDTGGS